MSAEPEGLVYTGSWRDAIPRALIFDPVLDAVSVRVYMYLFTQVTPTESAPFPSYDQIGRQLHVSRPTVVRAMHLLRATRWITLAGEQRGDDGRFLNNAYLIHDEPLALMDAIRLDASYLAYLGGLESHGNPRVRMTASAILSTIYEQMSRHETEPAPLEERIARRSLGHWDADYPVCSPRQIEAFHRALGFEDDDSDELGGGTQAGGVKKLNSAESGVKNINSVESRVKKIDSEPEHRVKNFNTGNESTENQQFDAELKTLTPSCSSSCSSCSSSKEFKETTTTNTPRAREKFSEGSDLIFPRHLNDSERKLAALMLAELEPDMQQELLDELAGQIELKAGSERPIRNPVQYLSWMCNQVRSGKVPLTSAGSKYRRARETEHARATKPRTGAQPMPQEVQAQVHAKLQSMKDALYGARKS